MHSVADTFNAKYLNKTILPRTATKNFAYCREIGNFLDRPYSGKRKTKTDPETFA